MYRYNLLIIAEIQTQNCKDWIQFKYTWSYKFLKIIFISYLSEKSIKFLKYKERKRERERE